MCTYHKNNNIQDFKDFEDFCKQNVIEQHKDTYKIILLELNNWIAEFNSPNVTSNDTHNIKRLFAQELNKQFRKKKLAGKKTDLICIYREMVNNKEMEESFILQSLLQKKPSRNISGITSITLVMSPHPNGQSFSCKHDCYYCPNEPAHEGNNFQDQPRSYLFNEPAVRRANLNEFKAYEQMISRMNTLYANGHIIDKLEIILEGGTYTEYPIEYLEIYHRDIFYAANTYFHITKKRKPLSIEEEIKINKTAKVHIIGICIETRPDAIDDLWICNFRYWGVTRIQLGVQHTSNYILKKVNRGHTIEQAINAIECLKDNCFKIDIHLMPDLPYSSPEMDCEMFDYIYTIVHPDQIKIYPCEVTPWTVIEQWYNSGKYMPYSENNMQDLIDVIKYGMQTCPSHIRLPRVIRDIPIEYIKAGNPYSNLRQMIYDTFEKENIQSQEIRSREIGRHIEYYNQAADYNIIDYDTPNGKEYFIAYESHDKKVLFGFLRLRLVNKEYHNPVFSSIKNMALIRELHVYGQVNAVGNKNNISAQHSGIGKKLLKIAEQIACKNNYNGIVVISGEGVKDYYKKLGYREIDTYMIKKLKYNIIQFIYIFIFICILIIINIYFINKYFIDVYWYLLMFIGIY